MRNSVALIVVLAGATFAPASRGQLVHRYSFTNDVSDSVGGANGNVVDPSGNYHTFANGQLDFSANDGQASNQDFTNPATQGAYANLPNGIVSSLGTKATFESWVTVATNRDWAEIYTFGKSDGAEDTSDGAGNCRYITLIPQNGQNKLLRYTHRGIPANAENGVDGPTALAEGVEHHIVTTWDETDTTAGADGTGYLYLDGALLGSVALRPDIRLSNLEDVNNFLGRSQWPDFLFDGSYDEFRIYNSALSAADVAFDFAAGPNAVPEPSVIGLAMFVGAGVVMRRRRGR